jgi:hypothetical protein
MELHCAGPREPTNTTLLPQCCGIAQIVPWWRSHEQIAGACKAGACYMQRPDMINRSPKHLRILALVLLSVGASLAATPSFARGNGSGEEAGNGAIDNDVYVVQRESVCMTGGPCGFVAHCPAESVEQGKLPNGAPYCTPTGPAHTLIP